MPREQKVKPCDNCKVKKRKCDGNLPCSTCVHSRKLTAPCSYSDNVITIGSGDAADGADKEYLINKVKELEQIIADLKATQISAPASTTTSSSTLEAFLATSADAPMPSYNDFGFDSLFLPGQSYNPDVLYSSSFSFENMSWQMQGPMEYDQITIENHLLSLSPTFLCTECAGEDGSVISPIHRYNALSESLKKAICFHGTFISTHPSLFSGSTAPSFQDRLRVATQHFECDNSVSYSLQGLCSANNFVSNRHLCDEISAVILNCVTNFSIGNGSKAIDLISRAFLMVRSCGLLNPCTFGVEVEKKPTMDDISVFLPSKVHLAVLTEQERADRLMLIFQLLACDLYQSMASANGFLIDDNLVPETNYPPGKASNPEKTDFKADVSARFTVWELSPFASSFSRVLADPGSINTSALYKGQIQIQFIKFFRKVMTWARANSDGRSPSISEQLLLHNTCIQFLSDKIGIHAVSSFMFGKLDSQIPSYLFQMQESLEVNVSHAEFLAMLCYIHYPSVTDTSRKFPIGNESNYSSIDVMFGLVRSLHFVIRRAYGLEVSQPIPKTLPPPAICHAVFALLCYVICSSVSVAFQSVKADYQQKVIVFGLLAEINNTLWGIGSVWPIARLFHEKLSQRLGIKSTRI